MNITRIEMEKQGAENKIPTNLTEGAGKKLRKRKEACDETLGDKPRVKDELCFYRKKCDLLLEDIRLQYLEFLRVEYFAYTLESTSSEVFRAPVISWLNRNWRRIPIHTFSG